METLSKITVILTSIIALFIFVGFAYNYYDNNKERINNYVYTIIAIIIVVLFLAFMEFIFTN